VKTAETHHSNMMRKLRLHTIAEFVLCFVRNDIVHVKAPTVLRRTTEDLCQAEGLASVVSFICAVPSSTFQLLSVTQGASAFSEKASADPPILCCLGGTGSGENRRCCDEPTFLGLAGLSYWLLFQLTLRTYPKVPVKTST